MNGRSTRRRVHQLICTVAVLLMIVGFVEEPAEAAPTLVRTFDHNVRLNKTGAINHVTANDPPLIVTAQELCRDQYQSIKSALESRGYTVWGIRTVDPSNACKALGSTNTYGGVLMVATKGLAPDPPLRGPMPSGMQYSGDTTTRSFVCGKASFILLSWWACTTHITPNSVSYAVAQSDWMRRAALFLNDRPVIVGGDFNRRPHETGPLAWYSQFYEVDSSVNANTYDNDPGDALYKKIDFIFTIRGRTDAAFGVSRVGCGSSQTASDHCFIHGYVHIL